MKLRTPEEKQVGLMYREWMPWENGMVFVYDRPATEGYWMRNTLIPLVTILGLTLPALLSGAIILEQIFSWPGMGSLFFESIRERDYPTMMGLILMFSVLTLLGQLLADILYAVVDPRITYS